MKQNGRKAPDSQVGPGPRNEIPATSIRRIAVLGAGTMGRGIAQVAAAAGFDVVLRDLAGDLLVRARQAIATGLAKSAPDVDGGRAALERITVTTDLHEAVPGADLIIEAVPESFELKCTLFREIDGLASRHSVLASNTSSLSIAAIAAVTSRPESVLGMHFFNPVDRMQLCEIVAGAGTAPETVAAARAVADRMGKKSIVVRDSPGFATSRLGLVLGLEAIRMCEQGVASAEDIDAAMELGYRHPMGPLRLTDLVGLDVRLAIAEHLHQALGSEAFRPPELLRQMVAEGRLGKKSGRGFYEWS